jgi:hypothetical protein
MLIPPLLLRSHCGPHHNFLHRGAFRLLSERVPTDFLHKVSGLDVSFIRWQYPLQLQGVDSVFSWTFSEQPRAYLSLLERGLISIVDAHLIVASLDSLDEIVNIDLGFFLLNRHFFDCWGKSIDFKTVQMIDLIRWFWEGHFSNFSDSSRLARPAAWSGVSWFVHSWRRDLRGAEGHCKCVQTQILFFNLSGDCLAHERLPLQKRERLCYFICTVHTHFPVHFSVHTDLFHFLNILFIHCFRHFLDFRD